MFHKFRKFQQTQMATIKFGSKDRILGVSWSEPSLKFLLRLENNCPENFEWINCAFNENGIKNKTSHKNLKEKIIYLLASCINLIELILLNFFAREGVYNGKNLLEIWFRKRTRLPLTQEIGFGELSSIPGSLYLKGFPFETWANQIIEQLVQFRKILDDTSPKLVVLSEDNILWGINLFVDACKSKKIPVVVYAYTNGVGEEFVNYFGRIRGIKKIISRMVSNIFLPKYSITNNSGKKYGFQFTRKAYQR